eukprot:9225238-Lingulodinium_polyedra.AAC.1
MQGQHPCLQQMARDLAPLQWARLQASMAEAMARALAGGDVAAVNLSKKAGALERRYSNLRGDAYLQLWRDRMKESLEEARGMGQAHKWCKGTPQHGEVFLGRTDDPAAKVQGLAQAWASKWLQGNEE